MIDLEILDATELVPAMLEHYKGSQAWISMRDYVLENFTQEIIMEVYKKMWYALEPINHAHEDSPDGLRADKIRDDADIIWYALDDNSTDLINKWHKEIDMR